MTDQSTAAAERSAHVTRGATTDAPEARCFICAGLFRGGSFAARCLPPLVQVCSAACAADQRYAGR